MTGGAWTWDITQKASGTQSQTEPPATWIHDHYFDGASPAFYVASSDKLVVYVLLNPCDPPREIMLMWGASDGWEHRAFWGEDLIDGGILGTPSRVNMGALPATGEWTRLEIPASAVGVGGQEIGGIDFMLYDGQVWWDRVGKSAGCTVPTAAAPASLPPDTVWLDDALPPGAVPGGTWVWDTSQKASGAQSNTEPSATWIHGHGFDSVDPAFPVPSGEKLIAYVLVNPCDPPREIMIEWGASDGWEHRAFWGEDLIPSGILGTPSRVNMGALPAAGQWVRLEIPASTLAMEGLDVYGLNFLLYNGQAWWDRVGQSGAPVPVPTLSSLSLNPPAVFGGASSTGTVTLSAVAPAGGIAVTLSSSNASVATVPASVTIAAGATSATFLAVSGAVASSASVTITAVAGGVTRTATLTVNPCSFGSVAPPASFPAGDVWLDDDLPAGAVPGPTWVWDTSQKASGTRSHTEPPAAWIHDHGFDGANPGLYVAATDKLVVYALLHPCDPPREIMLIWGASDGWEHRAFWGEDLIGDGILGTPSRVNMGALPAAGQWARLEVPASALGVGGQNIGGIDFELYDGQVWWDRIGKSSSCAVPVAAAPASLPPDTVWLDDGLPPGAAPGGTWVWDTSQKASGMKSHTEPSATWIHGHGFDSANPGLPVPSGEKLIAYVLINPCDTPREIMIEWATSDGWEHRAFWGEDLIPSGNPGTPSRVNMGALPAAGQWVRLEIPASTLAMEGLDVFGLNFLLYNGQAWWDRAGQSGSPAPVPSSLSLNPMTVTGGESSVATIHIPNPAPAGGLAVAVLSSSTFATVPASITIPAGSTSVDFSVTTSIVTAVSSATITCTWSTGSTAATLQVFPPPAELSSVVFSPSSLVGGRSATVWVLLDGLTLSSRTVPLTSSNPSVVPVPSSVTIAPFTNGASFTVTTTAVASTTPATISATSNAVTKQAVLTATPVPALVTFTLSRSSVLIYDLLTGTVTLNGPAPSGGALVTLSASDGLNSLPPNVLIPAYFQSATFQLQGGNIYTPTDVSIAAAYGGGSLTATLRVTPSGSEPVTLVLSKTSVVGGAIVTGTFNLSGVSATATTAGLSSSIPAAASVPATVTVPAHASSSSFTVNTSTVDLPVTPTITATAGDAVASADLSVTRDPVLYSLTLSRSTMVTGITAVGTVILNGPAQPDGAMVTLWSSNAGVAEVPASVIIPAGALSASFDVTAAAVPSPQTASIGAMYGGIYRSTDITVTPTPVISLFSLESGNTTGVRTVTGGTSFTGVIGLSGPAPAGGLIITLASDNPDVVSIPATVMIPANDFSASFTITTVPGEIDFTVPITATSASSMKPALVTVLRPVVTSLHFDRSSVVAGQTVNATITLSGPAPTAGWLVQVTYASYTLALSFEPGQIINAGEYSKTFVILVDNGTFVDCWNYVDVTAGGITSRLSVYNLSVSGISLSPTAVAGGGVSTATVTLNGTPDGSVTITLGSSNAVVASVPSSVTTTLRSVQFPVTAHAVAADTALTISAAYGTYITGAPVISSAALTVTHSAALNSLNVVPSVVLGGSLTTGLVLLTGPAPAGGISVGLSSTNAAVATVPASVFLAAGASSASFSITTAAVAGDTYVDLAASYAGISKTSTLRVTTNASGRLSALTVVPASLIGGANATATITLTGPAPAGGALVFITASDYFAITIPGSVMIVAGQSSATFTFLTYSVPVVMPVNLSATYAGETTSAVLTVKPAMYVVALSFNPPRVVGGSPSTGTVILSQPAPTGGTIVNLSVVAGSTSVSVPGTVTVAAGATTVTFTATTSAVSVAITTSVQATNGNNPVTAPLELLPRADLSSLALNPATVVGGVGSMGTATLNAPAPSGGVTVSLSSSNTTAATLSGNVTVPAGSTSATFAVTTQGVSSATSVTISGAAAGVTQSAVLTVNPGQALKGVAPGAALPGDPIVVLYGAGFDATTSVVIAGPIFSLSDTASVTPLCDLLAGTCPSTQIAAALGSGGTLAFALPSTLSTGYHWVRSRNSAGIYSINGNWLKIEDAQKTYLVVPPSQHNTAPRIYSGQAVTGTFAAGGDTTGTFSDYNTYYFFGTAGSVINASVQRVDTSKSWEDPSSLDPQVEIIAPDGIVYANLRQTDDQPGADYNATLTGAVLPQTGLYFLRAETTKGSGDYHLSFSFSSVVAAPPGARAIPFSGNFNTVAVNGSIYPTAFMLDPRGYTISGANVLFSSTPTADDHGTFQFVGGSSFTTQPDGDVSTTVQLTGAGRVSITPSFVNTVLAQWKHVRELESATPDDTRIPQYPLAVSLPLAPVGLELDGAIRFHEGKREEFPVWRPREGPARPRESGKPKVSQRKGGAAGTSASEGGGGSPASGSLSVTAVRPIGILSVESLTSCAPATFVEAGVTAASVNAPFTVILTDETPSSGQSVANGVVDASGIHGHRIEKTIRLKIDVRDASGSAPNFPVLVHLALGGPHHGTLILDPDGNRVQCDQGTFLWHERDAAGNIIALNEEFEYRLGTYAPYVGAIPDPGSPGNVKPVWGTAEILGLKLSTVDGSGVTQQVSLSYKVHPEPGKPDHFVSGSQALGGPDPSWQFWSDAFQTHPEGTRADGQPKLVTNPIFVANAYYLMDHSENPTFGHTNLTPAPTAPAANVTVGLRDQTHGPSIPSSSAADFNAYELQLVWTNDPAMPAGAMSTTVSVTFATDAEWAGGTVTKTIPLQFDRGTFHSLIGRIASYDGSFYSPTVWEKFVQDPDFPIVVSPGATGDAIPKVVAPTVDEFAGQPGRTAFLILNNSSGPVFQGPGLGEELSDSPAFRVSLVDGNRKVASGAVFKVHLCPRFDHFRDLISQRPCNLSAVNSVNGIVNSVRVNPNGAGADDSRAYLGVELVAAPATPGNYFVKFESLEGKQYRIRELSELVTDYAPAGEYQGAFAFATVAGIEILDSSFHQIYDLAVAAPQVIYVRYFAPFITSASVVADVMTLDGTGSTVTSLSGVLLSRIGASSVFLSNSITVDPPVGAAGPFRAHPLSIKGARSLELRAADGLGMLTATPENQPLSAAITTLTDLQFDFRVGQLGNWIEPNLLFGDGTDYVGMYVRVTDAAGRPLPQNFAVSMSLDQGSLSFTTANPDAQGRIFFRYTGPSLSLGQASVVRPTFGFTITFPDGVTTQAFGSQTARSPSNCRRKTDIEPGSHCFGDPHFPIVSARYDWRRATYYRSASDLAPFTDVKYTNGAAMSESDIQQFLQANGSALQYLYFVGNQADFDNTDAVTNALYQVGNTSSGWPAVYIDIDHDGHYTAAGDAAGFASPPQGGGAPTDGYVGVPFAHVLARWCAAYDINPQVMLTHLQAEESLVSNGSPAVLILALPHMMNYTGSGAEWPSVQVAKAVLRSLDYYQEAISKGVASPPGPHSGFLFPVTGYHASRASDQNQYIALPSGARVPASFFVQTNTAYTLFRYTNQVTTTPSSQGGNFLFMQLWAQYHFDQ